MAARALSDTTLHAQGEERPLTPVWVLKQLGGWGCMSALSDVPARLSQWKPRLRLGLGGSQLASVASWALSPLSRKLGQACGPGQGFLGSELNVIKWLVAFNTNI